MRRRVGIFEAGTTRFLEATNRIRGADHFEGGRHTVHDRVHGFDHALVIVAMVETPEGDDLGDEGVQVVVEVGG